MDENWIMLKPCPFCRGKVKITDLRIATYEVATEAECLGCGMEFAYSQDFVASKIARVACQPSFEELWNGQASDGGADQ